ncbi:hypothetical protein J2Y55_003102 [Bosea sp. BE125]|uniref:hypothetical protein n=1 Tax=Bosea sp. BE125 TaxID=2817909 RepID=UPI00285A6B69|nr:hypothetical protein [Bosea sp. BE125]MDR6872086.1 hypothetical protein [Bosea sp. BE125]
MLLPASLAGGQSSFIPANPDEATKPCAVKLELLGEYQLAGKADTANSAGRKQISSPQ